MNFAHNVKMLTKMYNQKNLKIKEQNGRKEFENHETKKN